MQSGGRRVTRLSPAVTFLSSASTALALHSNSVLGDLKSDEAELLYAAYGDETGVQCALRWVGVRPLIVARVDSRPRSRSPQQQQQQQQSPRAFSAQRCVCCRPALRCRCRDSKDDDPGRGSQKAAGLGPAVPVPQRRSRVRGSVGLQRAPDRAA